MRDKVQRDDPYLLRQRQTALGSRVHHHRGRRRFALAPPTW